jgi:hypothetical protein
LEALSGCLKQSRQFARELERLTKEFNSAGCGDRSSASLALSLEVIWSFEGEWIKRSEE